MVRPRVNESTPSLLIETSADDAGKRLDAFLAEQIPGWSRSRLQRLIRDEDVLVNSATVKSSYKVRMGDEIDIDLTEPPTARFEPENIPLDIVFEDEHIAVINKPAGMVVHPGAGISSGTLANALAFHFNVETSDLRGDLAAAGEGSIEAIRSRVGIVHRLDKDTSGLIVAAKDEATHEALSQAFQDRTVEKSYVALVHGNVGQTTGTIDRPIARDQYNRTRMRVAGYGRHALTLWRVKQRFEKFTLLGIDIKTGRTHQIRVHLASINYPIVGDDLYNEGRDKSVADLKIRKAIADLDRFFLHAEKLAFSHPITGQPMAFTQELPNQLRSFLDLLSV
jgi:23S rRNA pseudouridine1911/1915/1917 synthase